MPELPEVETIRRQMEKAIVGRRIEGVTVRYAGRISPKASAFARRIEGGRVAAAGRRAKLLLLRLSNGETVVAHLKMTGRFLLVKKGAVPSTHTHVVFALSGGNDLHFEDARKFGYLRVHRTADLEREVFAKYGPEPLDPSFTAAKFALCMRGRPRKPIKPLLMEQSCIAGIGNIYADEALWRAGIRPQRNTASLSNGEIARLYDGVRVSLRESLRMRGTSADRYVDLHGKKGKNLTKLNVYGRGGEPCPRCKEPVKKIVFSGRGTHFCPACQQ
jgi:formamidopyrimidine-DNA glycosylase